ncbi:MAG: GDSL-type esterase/lipase family protein [Eubacteriales bacterium]
MKILFQGDSVTDCDRNREDMQDMGTGYACKIAEMFRVLESGKDICCFNKGVSGNRTCDLLERHEEDVAKLQPDILVLLIGINDTWRRYDSDDATSTSQFEGNYTQLLEWIKKDLPDTKILIMEPFLLDTMPDKSCWREDLDPKIQVVRKLARKYADQFLPLDGILQQYVVAGYTEAQITEDGVHPTDIGHGIIAKECMNVLHKML